MDWNGVCPVDSAGWLFMLWARSGTGKRRSGTGVPKHLRHL